MRYHRTTDCDGRAVISTCRHDSSWVLSFLRCAALPGLMMWYYAFDFAPVKLESVAPMVLGLKRSFFRCYGWRLMLCCIFFYFCSDESVFYLRWESKNFMRRCPARRCAVIPFANARSITASPRLERWHIDSMRL
jgi:hypothetical protein